MVKIDNQNYNNEEVKTYKLDNGLRIIYYPTPSPVSYCGYAVNAGTRDEKEEESGMAHFVEHLIFKGTEKRKAKHILNCLSDVGGDIDAFTNKEETIVYATVLNEDCQRAIELLSDIVFHSTFPSDELEREREVIMEEIKSYDDNPSELIYDDFENIVFKGHPLGRNILGKADTISRFDTQKVQDFTHRLYHPDNMVLFASGRISFKSMIRWAEKYTNDLSWDTYEQIRLQPEGYMPQHIHMDKGTYQTHCIIGCPGYKAYDYRAAGLYLLNNLLGGPAINNRLNFSLREKKGLVYTVESNITPYTDTGIFCIYFGTEKRNLGRCMELTYKELKKFRDTQLTSRQLSSAKKQLTRQLRIASDNDENNMLDIGKIYLHYNRYETLQNTCAQIESLTAEKLLEIANDKFSEDNLTTLIYQ